jgi:hypothetical protein
MNLTWQAGHCREFHPDGIKGKTTFHWAGGVNIGNKEGEGARLKAPAEKM